MTAESVDTTDRFIAMCKIPKMKYIWNYSPKLKTFDHFVRPFLTDVWMLNVVLLIWLLSLFSPLLF